MTYMQVENRNVVPRARAGKLHKGVEPTRLTTCYMCVYATNLRLRERMGDCMNENQWTQHTCVVYVLPWTIHY